MQSQNDAFTRFICLKCHASLTLSSDQALNYCPSCGNSLKPSTGLSLTGEMSAITSEVSHIHEHLPKDSDIQFNIGHYQVIREIGKGGMGEVFIAYDTTCGRRIALKKIRTDLGEHGQLIPRFLKEARITSQLTHPAIIPIYAIHGESPIYYTMPYVEGETLKQVLRKTRQQERRGEKLDHVGGSIPSLIRIFLTICQAVAYAHSKGVLHRDLKPENIIIGQFGEVLILDWGLAKLYGTEEVMQDIQQKSGGDITRIGKIVGTIAYMAPERGMGSPATFQTDIYSLGVILYQILTLKNPFIRGTLEEFRKNMHREILLDPAEVAPYRDVPRLLAKIATKCLETSLEQRYSTVQELIHDLENYIEGRSEWFQMAELKISNKSDWEFQENVLIAEHIAITRVTEVTDWVSLMISKASFADNTKIEAKIRFGESGHGLGFLLSVPESSQRIHLNDGYCLWLGTDLNKTTKLLRSTVEVIQSPEIYLQRHEWYDIRIEKIDNSIFFYLNNALQFSYISHLPLAGTHVGLLSRDADFEIELFNVFIAGQNITVNCLAVPDAFLAHKDFATALSEYRRIGYSFPGRAEGREAMFRAGITLMEQGRHSSEPAKLYDLALTEFEKLHMTPGAPLEYLGKALVYRAMREYEEEIKCFELAFRRYPKHPLLPILQEQIIYRMYDSSRYNRRATYNFILLTVRHLHHIASSHNAKKLFTSLQRHWEILPFIAQLPSAHDDENRLLFAAELAFWLAKPYVLDEILNDVLQLTNFSSELLENVLFALIELGSWKLAQKTLENPQCDAILPLFNIVFICHENSLNAGVVALEILDGNKIDQSLARVILHMAEMAITQEDITVMHRLLEFCATREQEPSFHFQMQCYQIWTVLLEKNWKMAAELFHNQPMDLLNQDSTILHFLYGCWLYVTEGKELAEIHFSGVLEISYPPTWALFCYYLNGRISEDQEWIKKSFLWEKRKLYQQLVLFYHCIGDLDKKKHYQTLEQQQYHQLEE